MNVVLKLEGFLSWEKVRLKECDPFFMDHPVQYGTDVLPWICIKTKHYIKTKFMMVINAIKSNFQTKKVCGYHWYFLCKIVWFGIFRIHVPKIDILGISPTKFSTSNTNLLSQLENGTKYWTLNFFMIRQIWYQVELQNSIFISFIQFWKQICVQG